MDYYGAQPEENHFLGLSALKEIKTLDYCCFDTVSSFQISPHILYILKTDACLEIA